MILLLLGTNPYPFDRLLNAVDKWAQNSGEKIIAQTGHTPIGHVNTIECYDFVGYEQIKKWIKEAEFVITQGGFGSIKDCLANQKSVIAVPRIQEYGECQDSQKELVDALAEQGRLIPLYDIGKLPQAIKDIRSFVPPVQNSTKIPELVSDLINGYIESI